MSATIQIYPKGRGANPYIYEAQKLEDEFRAAGIEIEIYVTEALPPVDELLITVSIGVFSSMVASYIIRFIDCILAKKKENPNDKVSITIIDQSVNVSFNLPQEREKAIAHFEKKDKEKGKHKA